MELIDGDILNDLLHRQPLSLDEIPDIARQRLRGIQAIHRAGAIHLDINSSNVMLRRHSQ
jgi:serine/threonine protein kinase